MTQNLKVQNSYLLQGLPGLVLNNADKRIGFNHFRVLHSTAKPISILSDYVNNPKDDIRVRTVGSKVFIECVNRKGSTDLTPFSRIPSVLDSFVELTEDNTIMAKHGVKKRNASLLHLCVNTRTQSMNRYLMYVQHRLNALVNSGDSAGFWRFALLIARQSFVFKAIMFHELNEHWHREMTMKELYLLMGKYDEYWDQLPMNLKYKRKFIAKLWEFNEDGAKVVLKWRPLGVPTMAWRLYLHC